MAEVVDLSHRLDSWQVGGEAGGQGISLFTPPSSPTVVEKKLASKVGECSPKVNIVAGH